MTDKKNDDKEPKAKADLDIESLKDVADLKDMLENLKQEGQVRMKMERPGPWPDPPDHMEEE
jgi:hypothetical protein